MDTGSLAGVLLALAGILAGLLLEGGRISQIMQPTAAMIVFGGTLGAVVHWWETPSGREPSAAPTVRISRSSTWATTRAWLTVLPSAGTVTSRSTTSPGRA